MIVGSSLGGYLVSVLASRHPSVERLVLLAPAFRLFERCARLTPAHSRAGRRTASRRCGQYRAGFARCAECGVELLPFPTGARVPDTAGA